MSQKRWQQVMETPLTIAAVLFLVAYSWEIIAELQGSALSMAEVVIGIT